MKIGIFACLALCAMQSFAWAQDVDEGKELYNSHCATCHGLDLDGKGPMASALLLRPTSLHDLTARHDGTFPTQRVVMRIDGRDPLVSHGSPMPVYGPYFEGNDTPLKVETGQPIMTSRPIADLVAYLKSVQEQ